jgi:hypothetical protein
VIRLSGEYRDITSGFPIYNVSKYQAPPCYLRAIKTLVFQGRGISGEEYCSLTPVYGSPCESTRPKSIERWSSSVGRVGPFKALRISFISSSRYICNILEFKPKISGDSNRIRLNSNQELITQRNYLCKASTVKSCIVRRTP